MNQNKINFNKQLLVFQTVAAKMIYYQRLSEKKVLILKKMNN